MIQKRYLPAFTSYSYLSYLTNPRHSIKLWKSMNRQFGRSEWLNGNQPSYLCYIQCWSFLLFRKRRDRWSCGFLVLGKTQPDFVFSFTTRSGRSKKTSGGSWVAKNRHCPSWSTALRSPHWLKPSPLRIIVVSIPEIVSHLVMCVTTSRYNFSA